MNGYVVGGWSVTAGILALYTWRLLRRGRVLTRALPPERSVAPVISAVGESGTGASAVPVDDVGAGPGVRPW